MRFAQFAQADPASMTSMTTFESISVPVTAIPRHRHYVVGCQIGVAGSFDLFEPVVELAHQRFSSPTVRAFDEFDAAVSTFHEVDLASWPYLQAIPDRLGDRNLAFFRHTHGNTSLVLLILGIRTSQERR
jgi:hypothetical protein